jgi:hypothetical protein
MIKLGRVIAVRQTQKNANQRREGLGHRRTTTGARSTLWAFKLGTVLGMAALSAQGCAADTADEPEGAAFSLKITALSAERLTATATEADAKVYIELLRGGLRVNWQGDPAHDGNYEGDSLVTDAQGRAFLTAFGGDTAVDPSFIDRINKIQGDVDPDQRKLDLALAAKAGDRLAADPEVDFELRRLASDVGYSARNTLIDWNINGAPVGEPTTPTSDENRGDVPSAGDSRSAPNGVAVTSQALAAATYVHQVYIRKGSCCWGFGEHSATRLRVFNSSGTLLNDVKSNNHGRRVDDESMSTAAGCPRSWSGRSNQLPPFQPYLAWDTPVGGNSGGCATPYNDLPLTDGGHVCNDDSLAQYSNVKNNAALTWSTCSDSTLRTNAPTCN